MTIEKAKREIEKYYIRATKMKHIHNPIAWALYQVWRMADIEKCSVTEKDGDKS